MLEANIKIDDELAAKGFKRALKFKAMRDIAYHYGIRLMIIWLVLMFANGIMNAPHLNTIYLMFLAGLWLIASAYSYYDWARKIDYTKGWSFYAKIDELGVTTNVDHEARYEWSFYKNYKEFDDYLQIEDINGGISFLPKKPELFEIIEFTKRKISNGDS